MELREREAAQDAEKLRQQQAQQRSDADFLWLMEDERGRRFVWELLEHAGVFRISFNQNSMTTAFNEGCRNFGLKVLAQVHELCPDRYAQMLKENTHVRNDGRADHTN